MAQNPHVSAEPTDAVRSFILWCNENRSPKFLGSLNAAASSADLATLEARFAAHGVPFPRHLRALYAWHDGQDDARSDFARLFHQGYLLPVLDTIKQADFWDQMVDDGEVDGPAWWTKGWLPITTNGSSDYYVMVDLVGSFGGPKGQILTFYHDDEDRTIRAPDFDAWFETVVEGLSQGLIALNDGEWSYDEFDTFAEARLPGYPIYKAQERTPSATS